VFVDKRKAFDTAEQRKATDAAGKGIEEDPYSYKRWAKAAKQKPQAPQKNADPNKIPKWKIQSMQLRKGLQAANPTPSNNKGGYS
jgi:hypothetical protein